jgi:hypothetical protein
MMNIQRSLRLLASRPVFTVVVATVALGLGVNAAIFSLTREGLSVCFVSEGPWQPT